MINPNVSLLMAVSSPLSTSCLTNTWLAEDSGEAGAGRLTNLFADKTIFEGRGYTAITFWVLDNTRRILFVEWSQTGIKLFVGVG